jgi:hypothetical protein
MIDVQKLPVYSEQKLISYQTNTPYEENEWECNSTINEVFTDIRRKYNSEHKHQITLQLHVEHTENLRKTE